MSEKLDFVWKSYFSCLAECYSKTQVNFTPQKDDKCAYKCFQTKLEVLDEQYQRLNA